MKPIATFAMIAAASMGVSTVAFANGQPAPGPAKDHPIFASASWDDDDYDDDGYRHRRRSPPIAVPDVKLLQRAGIEQVTEVERDHGRLEVEGYDAQGREVKLYMDRDGKRVLSSRVKRAWNR